METNKLNTKARMRRGGRMAEDAFERVAPYRWVRSGFDQPDWSTGDAVGHSLPYGLTSMPDYIMDIKGEPAWVEAIGCKGDRVRSLKYKKLTALDWWAGTFQMRGLFFIYNSAYRCWVLITLENVDLMIREQELSLSEFHDGPLYYAVDYDVVNDYATWRGTA